MIDKETIIKQFSDFVLGLQDDQLKSYCENDGSVDLFALFQELAVLKTEVKQESRQIKSAIDNFKNAFDLLRDNCDTLKLVLNEKKERENVTAQKQRMDILRPILMELLDIRDRMEYAHAYMKELNDKTSNIFNKRLKVFAKQIYDGQTITIRRLDQLLKNQDVSMITTVGSKFCAKIMRAVEIDHNCNIPDGYVVEDIRNGFLLNGEILRVAEVKVNKSKKRLL